MRPFAYLQRQLAALKSYIGQLKQLHKWVARIFSSPRIPGPRRVRLAFESFEDRIVPSVTTYFGGSSTVNVGANVSLGGMVSGSSMDEVDITYAWGDTTDSYQDITLSPPTTTDLI
jgi:hypothetical protein